MKNRVITRSLSGNRSRGSEQFLRICPRTTRIVLSPRRFALSIRIIHVRRSATTDLPVAELAKIQRGSRKALSILILANSATANFGRAPFAARLTDRHRRVDRAGRLRRRKTGRRTGSPKRVSGAGARRGSGSGRDGSKHGSCGRNSIRHAGANDGRWIRPDVGRSAGVFDGSAEDVADFDSPAAAERAFSLQAE